MKQRAKSEEQSGEGRLPPLVVGAIKGIAHNAMLANGLSKRKEIRRAGRR